MLTFGIEFVAKRPVDAPVRHATKGTTVRAGHKKRLAPLSAPFAPLAAFLLYLRNYYTRISTTSNNLTSVSLRQLSPFSINLSCVLLQYSELWALQSYYIVLMPWHGHAKDTFISRCSNVETTSTRTVKGGIKSPRKLTSSAEEAEQLCTLFCLCFEKALV